MFTMLLCSRAAQWPDWSDCCIREAEARCRELCVSGLCATSWTPRGVPVVCVSDGVRGGLCFGGPWVYVAGTGGQGLAVVQPQHTEAWDSLCEGRPLCVGGAQTSRAVALLSRCTSQGLAWRRCGDAEQGQQAGCAVGGLA